MENWLLERDIKGFNGADLVYEMEVIGENGLHIDVTVLP